MHTARRQDRRHRDAARRDLRRPGQHPADPPGRRGPAGRRPPGHAHHQEPRRGPRRWRASPTARRAPAGPVRARPRAPQFAGGGVVHGPTPRSYAQRTPKKMKAAALRGALSDRARNGRVHVVAGLFEGDVPSTSTAVAVARRSVRAQARARGGPAGRRADLEEPAQRPSACTCSTPTSSTPTTCSSRDDVVFTRGALDDFLAGPVTGRSAKGSATEAEAQTGDDA